MTMPLCIYDLIFNKLLKLTIFNTNLNFVVGSQKLHYPTQFKTGKHWKRDANDSWNLIVMQN